MDFSEEVEDLLSDKEYDKLLDIIFNPDNIPKIQAFGMDLITRLCECGLAFCMEPEALSACQDMLMHVVRCVRPKEALISLLEQAEMFAPCKSEKFTSLLAPLQFVMMNLPKKREHSFSWVLSILNSHMKAQHKFPPTPKKRLTQGKDALVLEETSKEIREMLTTYNQFCNFYEPFICQFWVERNNALTSNDQTAIASINRQQEILRDNLVQLLGDPLLHFDLHWEESKNLALENNEAEAVSPSLEKGTDSSAKIKTDARLISERIMGFLKLVDQHPEYYYDWVSRKMFHERSNLNNKPVYCGNDDDSGDGDADESIVDFSSVVNYNYLIYCELVNADMMPSVLSPTFVFLSTVRLMSAILSDDNAGPNSLLKCFSLAKTLLSKIDESVPGLRLESELLETSFVSDFIESVAFHTVFCESVDVRRQGLQVLREMMWKFEPRGRYDFILFVFNRIEHDGIRGYIIVQGLKNCVEVALSGKNKEMEEFFTGKFLLKQLRMTCSLKDGVTTDLIDNKEKIMSALNFILYLVIRDKVTNVTGIADVLPELEQRFLEPLYKALQFSRAHYKLKLKELNDPKALQEQTKEQKRLSENVGLELLNNAGLVHEDLQVSVEQQKQSVNSALFNFDLMNGVLGRVNELCGARKKNKK